MPVWLRLEIRAINTAAFWSANFIHQRKLEGAVAVGCWEQAGRVHVVAEADGELLVIEAGAGDHGIHQFAFVQAVGEACPQAKLESLVVATAVAEQEFEGVTDVHLPGWALEEGYHAWAEAEFLSYHKFTASMESEFAVERNIGVLERLVGAVQVVECTAKIEVGFFAEYAKPQSAG